MISLARRGRGILRKRAGVLLAMLALASCGAPKPRPPATLPVPGAGTAALPSMPRSANAVAYRIDTSKSELRLLVYRGGPMGRLGHNHVIVNRTVSGWVSVAKPMAASSFAFTLPAANFSVDEAQLRSAEGADFADEVPDEAKSGTLRNMLGPALLDAKHHPLITVTSVAVGPDRDGSATATLAMSVAGHQSTLELPFALENSGGQLSATGQVKIRQSTLGLVPFSIMMGALQVEDEITVKFKLVAEAT